MPRRIHIPKIVFHFEDTPESREGLRCAYRHLFDLAREEIIKEREKEKLNKDEK